VHHFGHRTFDGERIDLKGLLERNQQIFQEKWGTRVIGHSSLVTGNCAPQQMTYDQGQTTISCCMIVRNSETTIAAAVESIKPWVGQVVVVDTGSTDRTVEICRSLGCEVYHFPWPDSFAEARNESLKYARGDWTIWIDADDVIDPENDRKLREIVAGVTDPNVMGLTMKGQIQDIHILVGPKSLCQWALRVLPGSARLGTRGTVATWWPVTGGGQSAKGHIQSTTGIRHRLSGPQAYA
jgi:hypothetical protein